MTKHLLTKAFQYARDMSDSQAKDELRKEFHSLDLDAIVNACSKAADLIEHATQLADRIRDGNADEKVSIMELEKKCPGFEKETYERALGHGFFLTR